MAQRKVAPDFVPGRGYTQDDWNEVSDTPEITEEELARARPFAEVFPEMAKQLKRRPGQRGKGRKPAKVAVSMRLAPEIVERYQAAGADWRARMERDLRKAIGLS